MDFDKKVRKNTFVILHAAPNIWNLKNIFFNVQQKKQATTHIFACQN